MQHTLLLLVVTTVLWSCHSYDSEVVSAIEAKRVFPNNLEVDADYFYYRNISTASSITEDWYMVFTYENKQYRMIAWDDHDYKGIEYYVWLNGTRKVNWPTPFTIETPKTLKTTKFAGDPTVFMIGSFTYHGQPVGVEFDQFEPFDITLAVSGDVAPSHFNTIEETLGAKDIKINFVPGKTKIRVASTRTDNFQNYEWYANAYLDEEPKKWLIEWMDIAAVVKPSNVAVAITPVNP